MAAVRTTALTAGIDEAGRGALAGPVVAGACIISVPLFRRRSSHPLWSPHRRIPSQDVLLADSKILSSEQRAVSYAWISDHCAFGIGIVEAEEIERIGILRANEQAMRLAVAQLCSKATPALLLVDGKD